MEIKIDVKSIKKNPDAFKQQTHIFSSVQWKWKFEGKLPKEFINNDEILIVQESFIEGEYKYEGIITNPIKFGELL